MKKTILLLTLSAFAISLQAQIYVDGKDVSADFPAIYLIIEGPTSGVFSDFDAINVDYGKPDYKLMRNYYLTDSNGKVLKFKSIVGALNYFDENGWEYKDYLPYGGDSKGGRYLLKRKQ